MQFKNSFLTHLNDFYLEKSQQVSNGCMYNELRDKALFVCTRTQITTLVDLRNSLTDLRDDLGTRFKTVDGAQ